MKNIGNIKTILFLLGCLAIVIGLGTSFYTYFVLRPKMLTLSKQVTQGLGALESTTQALKEHDSLFSASLGGMQAGAEMANLLPETLTSLKGTLIESAELLYASSSVTKEAEEGISGLVLADKNLTATARFMRKTATQLRLMVGMVDKFQNVSSKLDSHATEISSQLTQLRSTFGPLKQLLENARANIQDTQNALNSLSLPTQISLAGIGFGGLYTFLGVALLALSTIYEKLSQLGRMEDISSVALEHPKKIA